MCILDASLWQFMATIGEVHADLPSAVIVKLCNEQRKGGRKRAQTYAVPSTYAQTLFE